MNARPDLDYASRAAESVLAVDMSDVLLESRVPQFVVGWCRGAFAQIRAIVALTDVGFDSAAGPNLRLMYELIVRLLWLSSLEADERRRAVDERLEFERGNTKSTVRIAQSMGYASDFPLDEMLAFKLDSSGEGPLSHQAKNLRAAVDRTEGQMLYALWREASGFAHASGAVAQAYAPALEDAWIGGGLPDPQFPRGEALVSTMLLLVTLTSRLLRGEGVSVEAADRFLHAYAAVE